MRLTPCDRMLFLLLLALAGCDDPALQRGVPPPIVIDQAQAVIPLYEFGAARVLRSQVAALGASGGVGRLDASIETLSKPEVEATRNLLLQLGLNPARITIRSEHHNVVVLTRNTTTVTSCGAALQPDWLGDVGNSVTSLGTCVQANNLARMIDDPRNLAVPVRLEPADGAVSALAVQRWEQGEVQQSPHTATSSGGGGSGGGDAGGGGSPASSSAAPQSAGAAAVNPLLSNAPLTGAPGASAE